MEWDWTTFLLEIINVLVLVWLLKRFLYQPVLTVIEERKAAIAKTLANAHQLQSEAKILQDRYEQRLTEWEKEKEKVRARLQEEIVAERQQRLATLQTDLEKERQQASVRERQRNKDLARQAEALALLQGTQFTTSLLSRVAGPELEVKLIEAAMEDFLKLPQQQIDAMKSTIPGKAHGRVTTAFPLDAASRERVMKKAEGILGRACEWTFAEDHDLLAGLRVSVGGWVLRGNLQDELKFFAEGEIDGH